MNLFDIEDTKCKPDIVSVYPPTGLPTGVPIIIDNGSYQCRAGWASKNAPTITFKNVLAKPRKDRNKKDAEVAVPTVQIGNDIANIEAVRFQLRTQFDRNVVTHFHIQEQILDYMFGKLGVNVEGCVPHPLLLSECVANPNHSRALMSELLFECYGIPGICYGIDSLFSYSLNSGMEDGLIISCGYHTTHVIPVLNGKMVEENVRRINVGGFNMINFMHRLLQLKYPVHVNAITLSRAESLIHRFCSFAYDYTESLKNWALLEFYDQNIIRIQLPYNQTVSAPTLTAEQRTEKRKELSRRLAEINQRKREEKLAEDKHLLTRLVAAQEDIDDEDRISIVLEEFELKNVDEMKKTIVTLRERIAKTVQKMNTPATSQPEEKPLLLQPPANTTIQEWVVETRKKRDDILDRKQTRKQRKQDLAKRRTVAAQERMRIISQLAKKEKGVDDFGMRDEDWDVYKSISREGDSDSDAENEKLLVCEEILKQHDSTYVEPTTSTANIAEFHQLHVGVEAIRVPEILFQPSLIGIQEAGLAGAIDYVLKLFPREDRPKLFGNIMLTGGCANIRGFKERLMRELQQMLPFQSVFNLRIVTNPTLDGWKGASKFATSEVFKKSLITRQTYDECGGEYLKEHPASNVYFPTPNNIDTAERFN
ncbi:actin-related protein 5 [Toxorhynchites rutilus septentrionalis]|uniref:actin-related protein 5 n=1 Tax=Toxorhynchites rutilus septentrionalis TaxID=329112 RepID=UPI0024786D65|nr:actin-related protein 5 [Toxorhynchites rutilus septentrionalis]